MLKRNSFGLLAFCLLLPNFVSAEEPHERWLHYFEGAWAWTSDNGMAGSIRFERVEQEVPALVVHFESREPDRSKSLAVMGWNAKQQMIVETGFNSFGGNGQTRYKIVSDDVLDGTWTAHEADGNMRHVKYELNRLDADTYVLKFREADSEEDQDTWTTITVKRKSDESAAYMELKPLEWMIGDWEGTWVVGEGSALAASYPVGAKVKSHNTYAWMQNKNYIGLKFRDEIDGTVTHEGFEMIGWDAKAKKRVHWLYSILGGSGVGEWSKDGDTWKLDWSYTTGDGTSLEGVAYLTPVDENTHTWQLKHMKENGQDASDGPLVTFRRK